MKKSSLETHFCYQKALRPAKLSVYSSLLNMVPFPTTTQRNKIAQIGSNKFDKNFATTSKIMLIDCNWIQQQITMDLSLRSSTYTCQVGQSPPSPFTIPTLITCQKKQVRIARLMRLSFGSQCWAMLDVFRFGFLLNLRAQLTVSGGNASG